MEKGLVTVIMRLNANRGLKLWVRDAREENDSENSRDNRLVQTNNVFVSLKSVD